MSSYKVGDLASLITPSSSNTGKKLQSLFNEHYNKKGNSKVKNPKSHSKNFVSDCDVESISTKKTKKKRVSESSTTTCSPLKNVEETDFNSDFLPLQGKKKEATLNLGKKRKGRFSENSVTENTNQNVEQPKKVKAFIRTAKSKRQKIAEQEDDDAISVKPMHVKENLFSESGDSENPSKSQSKKQKNKKKSNKSLKDSSALSSVETGNQNGDSLVHSDTAEQEDDDVISVKPVHVKENLFSESGDSENSSKKQKKKKKSNKSSKDSSALSSVETENQKVGSLAQIDMENENVDSLAQTDSENEEVNAEKIRQENIKDLPCTIFVGNLPVSLTRKMLHKLFISFGQIKSVRLRGAVSTKMSIPKKVAEIKHEYHKGLQSHTGFVVFKDEKSAKNALSLNGTLIEDHHIVVDFASQAGEKKLYDNDLSVFLGNLPFDIDDETVRSAFEECGKIQAVRIIRDKATGLGKGFGYVQFQKMKSKEKALKLSDLEIKGRKIRVKPIDSDQRKNPGSKKTLMMIRNNVAVKRTKGSGSKKSVKKLLKKGRLVHQKKQVTRLLGEKFVK